MNPAVSIVIPTYNRAGLIARAVESVVGQSFTAWECLVIDDHSTDHTHEIIKGLSDRDARVSYYRNERKKGAQGARNTGLYKAKGEWVFFFDSDNVMHPDALQRLMERANDEVDVVTCYSDIIDVEKGATGKILGSENEGCIHDSLFTGQCYVDFNHAIIRKSRLLQIAGLDEDCPSMQEWDTHIRMSSKAIYTTVRDSLVDYYVGGKDAISTDKKREVAGRLYILKKHEKEWKKRHKACVNFAGQILHIIRMNQNAGFRRFACFTLFRYAPEAYCEMLCRHAWGYCRKIISWLHRSTKKVILFLFSPYPNEFTAIIVIDGGICSQMFEYALGEFFREKGYRVLYDLWWFSQNAYDSLHRDRRYYEIDRLFPNINIEECKSKLMREKFSLFYKTKEKNLISIVERRKPVYLINDHPLDVPEDKVIEILCKLFSHPNIELDCANKKMLSFINGCENSCAVHIRRGDLANQEVAEKSGYGKILTDSYYIKAIDYMRRICGNPHFFFFSDDLAYVKTIILPQTGNNCTLVDSNEKWNINGGSYKDLYLISWCKHQICSLGSFGKYGALMNNNSDKIVILPHKKFGNYNNFIILDSNGKLIASSDTYRYKL